MHLRVRNDTIIKALIASNRADAISNVLHKNRRDAACSGDVSLTVTGVAAFWNVESGRMR